MMSYQVRFLRKLSVIDALSEIKVRFDPKLKVLSYETIV